MISQDHPSGDPAFVLALFLLTNRRFCDTMIVKLHKISREVLCRSTKLEKIPEIMKPKCPRVVLDR